MNISQLQQFLGWCAIVNLSLLLLSFVIIVLFRSRIFRLHARLFGLPKEEVGKALYLTFGIYKILIFVFNIVPWIALQII